MAEPHEPIPKKPGDATPVPSRVDRVGESLRRVFDDAATEPLPQAFEDLLRQLR